MIGWWLLGEMLRGRSAWTVPNLLATTFYGEGAYQSGFIVPTWAGLAGAFVVYCVAGMLFAVVGRERRGGWFVLAAGLAYGLVLNWLFFGTILVYFNPLVRIYAPDRLIMVSHLLYGVALASYPSFARQAQWVAESATRLNRPVEPGPPPIPDSVAAVGLSLEQPAPEQAASEIHTSDAVSDEEIGGSIP